MARLTSLKHLFVAAIGIGGIGVACRATSPKAPPLAPAPDNAPAPSPVPSGPIVPDDPSSPGPNFPSENGGAPMPGPQPKEPGPISTREMPIPDLRAERYQLVDAGMRDAATARDAMPADSMIYDASPRTDATLPPVSDAAVRRNP